MGYHFRDAQEPVPEPVRQWADPAVWKLVALVDELDMSGFEEDYRADGVGGQPYDPRLMLVTVWWCLQHGRRRPDEIARECRESATLRVVWGRQQVPTAATVRRFIGGHRRGWQQVHAQTVATCHQAGLLDLSTTATDSTPMDAPAALAKTLSAPQITVEIAEAEQRLDQIRAEIAGLADAGDVPGFVEHGCGRLRRREQWLLVCLGRLRRAEATARARSAATAGSSETAGAEVSQLQRWRDRVARHRAELQVLTAAKQQAVEAYQAKVAAGRKPRGSAPRPPGEHPRIRDKTAALARAEARLAAEEAKDPTQRRRRGPAARANLTDPTSRILKGKNTTTWVLGRLLTITVCLGQVILAGLLSEAGNDHGGLHPNLTAAAECCRQAAIPTTPRYHLADAGFASTQAFTTPSPFGGQLYIAVTNEHDQTSHHQPPAVAQGRQQMAARLATADGAAIYRRRTPMVEPVFAHLLRTDRTLHSRGQAQDSEVLALISAHNAGKYQRYHNSRHRPGAPTWPIP